METLEILKAIKEQHLTDRQLGLLDLLEEAMKPKTCEGCKNLYINQYDEFSDYCKELGIEISKAETANFYCNRYEAKDTQC